VSARESERAVEGGWRSASHPDPSRSRPSCVPSVLSPEAALIAVQGALLVSRTLLTDHISRIEARAGRHLLAQRFGLFGRGLVAFAAVAAPAACVNAGLKLFQKRIALACQARLTRHLHAGTRR